MLKFNIQHSKFKIAPLASGALPFPLSTFTMLQSIIHNPKSNIAPLASGALPPHAEIHHP